MKIVVFGGSFNPAGTHHREIAAMLSGMFDKVKIVVCGPRPDKPTTNDIDPVHRAAMADLTFGQPGSSMEVDISDLENETFTRTHELDARYSSEGEVWHLIGTDLIAGGHKKESAIHKVWKYGGELWERLNFVVALRAGVSFDERDLPPKHIILRVNNPGSSEEIRRRASNHGALHGLVTPEVREYIERHNLYRGYSSNQQTRLVLDNPKLLVVADSHNNEAAAIAKSIASLESAEPNLVVSIGGDGTMLRAIKRYWRLRLPFFGINAGHLGFLLNDVSGTIDGELFGSELTGFHSPLLYVQTANQGGDPREFLAFNDAWVETLGKAGWFEIKVDGRVVVPRLVGDGVLVSTAAGSAAYAQAMGAKPVPIGKDILVVVGSNVFEPLHWQKNLPLESLIEFRSVDKTGYRKVYGFADGEALGEIVSMRVRRSRIAAAELMFLRDNDIRRKVLAQ